MNGVIYIAFGEKYVSEAVFSAGTVKKHSGLPVTIFTDKDPKHPNFDRVELINPEHKRAKVDFLGRSPYERTLYLDSDTSVERDISDVFDVLDRFDLAAVQDYSRKSSKWSTTIPAYDAVPYAFPEYNGGVILYRAGEKTARFLQAWNTTFYENRHITKGLDQASFRISLWNSDLAIHALPTEFNVRNHALRQRMAERARDPADEGLLKPRIYHWHGLDKPRGPLDRFRARLRPLTY